MSNVGINSVVLMGRLSDDPELQYTHNHIAFCRFTIAVPHLREKGKTNFIPCIAWRDAAKFLVHSIRKGTLIIISGQVETQLWQEDDVSRYRIQIYCSDVRFGESKRSIKDASIHSSSDSTSSTVKIYAVDEIAQRPVKDAIYELRCEATHSKVHRVTTDQHGIACVAGLRPGKYTLIEVACPETVQPVRSAISFTAEPDTSHSISFPHTPVVPYSAPFSREEADPSRVKLPDDFDDDDFDDDDSDLTF